MKNRIRSYITFSSKERAGLAVLLVLLLLLIGIKATMHLWVQPDMDRAEEERLRQAWENYKASGPDAPRQQPGMVSINKADSATLVQVKGIDPEAARKIIWRRRIIGPYTDIEQLRETCSLPDTVFADLRKHVCL
ncbi:hypothetical protein GCM10023093_31980 [Nemorincola caseinilytica]|uniref:Helix-hairpin-helix motif-containing protein n=1 Tax=Nemorincola caseinilytica TaxID=2054315 RepID=A0ABP8NT82_9BACT